MSKKSRAVLGILGVSALSAVGIFGMAGAANAEVVNTPPANCSTYHFCLYEGGKFDGWVYANSGNVPAVPASVNDQATSLFNRGASQNIFIYQHANYNGYRGYVQRGYGMKYLGQHEMGNSNTSWSDKISSFQWTTATSNG